MPHWTLLQGVNPGIPYMLSGGLHAGNVADAIRRVQPFGVDVSSGVESSPGIKGVQKIEQFVAAARAAALETA